MSIAKLFLTARIRFFRAFFAFRPRILFPSPRPPVLCAAWCRFRHTPRSIYLLSVRICEPFVYSLFLYAPTRPVLYISAFWPPFSLAFIQVHRKTHPLYAYPPFLHHPYILFCKMWPCKTTIGFSHIKTPRFYTKNSKSAADTNEEQ